MKPNVKFARDAFRAVLKEKGAAKRKKKPVKAQEKAAPIEKVTKSPTAVLNEIRALLKQEAVAPGSVEFVVTRRDSSGNVKSFKVVHG